jgi:hypothetical protein
VLLILSSTMIVLYCLLVELKSVRSDLLFGLSSCSSRVYIVARAVKRIRIKQIFAYLPNTNNTNTNTNICTNNANNLCNWAN